MEDKLIMLLASNKNKVMSYKDILDAIPDFITKEYVSVTIYHLRQKGYRIETYVGKGYRYLE